MRPVFIGGCGRSGTTMLGDLLGVPRDHLCLPESTYKSPLLRAWRGRKGRADTEAALAELARQPKFRELGVDLGPVEALERLRFGELFDRVVAAYAASVDRGGARVWIDQSPNNALVGRALLQEWPEARLLHVVRDGRAVAASVMPLDWGPNNPIAAAQWWTKYLAHGLALEAAFPERVLRVRYERLVAEPEPALREICAFAGVDFDPAMSRGGGLRLSASTADQHALVGKAPSPARIDAWRAQLTPRQIELFEVEAGQLLPILGYVPVYGDSPRPASPLATLVLDTAHRVRNLTINRLRKKRRRRRAR
jgi:hypothetical protein